MADIYFNHRKHCGIRSNRCESCYTFRGIAEQDLQNMEDSLQAQRTILKPTEELQASILDSLLISIKVQYWCKAYLAGIVLNPSDPGMTLNYRSLVDMEYSMKGIWDVQGPLNKQVVVYRMQLAEARVVVLERQFKETEIVLERTGREIREAEKVVSQWRLDLDTA